MKILWYLILFVLLSIAFIVPCVVGYDFGAELFRGFVPKYEQTILVG